MTFGERLISLRESNNVNRKDLATQLEIPYTTLRNYEKDVREPGHVFLIKVSKVFNINVDYLLGLEDEKNTNTASECKFPSMISNDDQVALNLYRQLDINDKGEIKGEMKGMLKAPKYKRSDFISIEEKQELPNIDLTTETKENMTNAPNQADEQFSRYPLTYFDDLPVSAGTGFYSMDIANSITIELRTPPPKGASYMVKVTGDSMHPTIKDGDKIFIKNDKCIKVGEIGIFILNSDFYVKELGEGCLLSHNPKFPPIPIREGDNIVCRGKFIGICKEDFK